MTKLLPRFGQAWKILMNIQEHSFWLTYVVFAATGEQKVTEVTSKNF